MKLHDLKILPFILCLLGSPELFSQNGHFLWAKNPSTINGLSTGNSICTDSAGNIIISGSYGSDITFGATTLTSYGMSDAYVVKYDPSGNVTWATSIGGAMLESAPAVHADAAGNIIVAGSFNSADVYFGSPSVSLHNPAGNGNHYDFLLAKYDPAGNLLWKTNASCLADDGAISVSTDSAGNIYMAGDFFGDISFGSTTIFNANSNSTTDDALLVKFDPNGNFQWARSIGGTGWEAARSIGVDPSGNIFLTGMYNSSSMTIGTTTLHASGNRIFIAKYDTNGNPLWAEGYDGESHSVSVDPGGNVFLAGNYFSSSVTFGSTVLTNNSSADIDDIFLAKFDPNGNVLWAKSAGGDSTDECFSSATDGDGNVFITGIFQNRARFDAVTLVDTTHTLAVFIAKYGPEGHLYCINYLLVGGNQMTDGIAANHSGNAYLAATFYNNPMITGPDTLTLTGNEQVFIAGYNCCGLAGVHYSSDTTIVPGTSATLYASGGLTYAWSNGSFDSSIVVYPASTTDYCVVVSDSGNCLSSDCIQVNVEDECSLSVFIANAFSPNGDGANDYVQVHIHNPQCVTNFYIAIFDRWGEKVFESDDPDFKWDGTYHGRVMASQVVTYFIRTISIDGKENVKKGNISIVL